MLSPLRAAGSPGPWRRLCITWSLQCQRRWCRNPEVFLSRPSTVLKAAMLVSVRGVQELNSVPGSVKSSYIKLSTARPHSPVPPYVVPWSFCPYSQGVTVDWFSKQEGKCHTAGLHNKPMGKMPLFLSFLRAKPPPSPEPSIFFFLLLRLVSSWSESF